MTRFALFASLLMMSATARADFIGQVLTSNPQGFWILNDAPSLTTTATDSSGNAFNGTYGPGVTPQGIAGPSWVPSSGLVAEFTGGTISFPTRLNLGSNGYTIEAWIDPSLSSLTETTRIADSGSGVNGYGFGTGPGGALVFTSFSQHDYETTGLTLRPNQWQYVGVVVDASNDASFYVNGVLVQTVPGTLPTTAPTGDFTLGNQSPGLGHTDEIYQGGLAGVSVYDTALTSAQIQGQYDAAQTVSAIPEPPTTALIGSLLLFFALLIGHRKRENLPVPELARPTPGASGVFLPQGDGDARIMFPRIRRDPAPLFRWKGLRNSTTTF